MQEEERCSCFSLAQVCGSRWKLCEQIWCVIHPSSYTKTVFTESYNKLLALEYCVAELLGQPLHHIYYVLC